MRISDWSSDVCSSDLERAAVGVEIRHQPVRLERARGRIHVAVRAGQHRGAVEHQPVLPAHRVEVGDAHRRSEEHTSELQSLMRISYAACSLNKKTETHTFMLTSFSRSSSKTNYTSTPNHVTRK